MKLKIIIFAIANLFGAIISAQNINIQKIDSLINHIENNNRDIGSISIFKAGEEIYNRSFGQQQLSNIKYNSETKYQIGSITKMITATLIFKLIEQDKLSLEEKLSTFFQQIPNSNKITIKNLLEHSSGLGDFSAKENDILWLIEKVSKEDIFNEIIKQGSLFEPNSQVRYSNSGYFLLAQIVEKLYEKDYASIVENEIANILNLNNFESITENTTNTFASFIYKDEWEEIKEFEFSNIIGLGDMVSTTKDLNTFLYNLFQYKIIKKESIEQMLPKDSEQEIFGRGFMLIPFYEKTFYGHGGDTFGSHSMVAYNTEDQLGISIAINGERFPHNDFSIGVLSIIYEKEYDFPEFKTVNNIASNDLDKFVGIYSCNELPIKLTITREGNTLKAQGSGQPAFYLECFETNKFSFEAAKLELEFIPEENKAILNQMGMRFEMKKEE